MKTVYMVKTFDDFDTHMNESGAWDWLTGKKSKNKDAENTENPTQHTDQIEDKSSDLEVNSFYKELEDFANSGKSVVVQSKGNMQYSELVKKIQMGLDFLGFKLPNHGIDGLFGPETAHAIEQFNASTKSNTQPVDESLLPFGAYFKNIYEAANGKISPDALENIGEPGKQDGPHKLNDEAAAAYDQMKAAAEADGITWKINDSYRDYDQQVKTAKEKGLYKDGGLAAVPGTSNHGWGSAVDLQLDTNALNWLKQNAAKFGFSNISREHWHWEHKSSIPSAQNAPQSTASSTISLIDGNLIKRLIFNLKNRGFNKETLAKYATSEPTSSGNTQNLNDDAFYRSILKMLGANETPEKMKFLKAWRQAEGGKADYNPFNTTKNLRVSGIRNYNSVGVKEYPNAETGLSATVATLRLPYYKNLVSLLQDDSITADQLANSPDLNTWGTKDGVIKVLAGGRVNPPAIATSQIA